MFLLLLLCLIASNGVSVYQSQLFYRQTDRATTEGPRRPKKSANSKKVLKWSFLPIQQRNLPGGQREQWYGVVLDDQGEDYQQP